MLPSLWPHKCLMRDQRCSLVHASTVAAPNITRDSRYDFLLLRQELKVGMTRGALPGRRIATQGARNGKVYRVKDTLSTPHVLLVRLHSPSCETRCCSEH